MIGVDVIPPRPDQRVGYWITGECVIAVSYRDVGSMTNLCRCDRPMA